MPLQILIALTRLNSNHSILHLHEYITNHSLTRDFATQSPPPDSILIHDLIIQALTNYNANYSAVDPASIDL